MDEPAAGGPLVRFLAERYGDTGHVAAEIPREVDETFSPPGVEVGDRPDTSEQLVRYDLAGWPTVPRLELEGVLELRNIEHLWHGSTLLVPDRLEVSVDELLDELGRRAARGPEAGSEDASPSEDAPPELVRVDLGAWDRSSLLRLEHMLAGSWPQFDLAWGPLLATAGDPAGASSSLGIPHGRFQLPAVPHAWEGTVLVAPAEHGDLVGAHVAAVERAVLLALDPEADRIAYDLEGYPDDRLTALLDELAEAGIPHELTDDEELIVHEVDEDAVEDILDRVDHPDELPAEELDRLEAPDDGLIAQQVLSDLFVAADRLRRDGRNPEAILDLVRAAEQIQELAVPFGFSDKGWSALQEAAASLGEHLSSGEFRAPEVEERADELRTRLRPLV